MLTRLSPIAVLVTAVLWVVLFSLNKWLFSSIEVNAFVTWIFLPAALRMVSVLLVDWQASVGLVLGAFLTADLHSDRQAFEMVPLALISGFGPLLAKYSASRWMGVDSSLTNLRAIHLWGYAVMGGTINSVLSQAYLQWLHPSENPASVMLTMFVGDVLGSVMMLLLVSWLLDKWSLLQREQN
jgi:hypothetical protein